MKKVTVLSNMYPSNEHPTYGIFVKNQVELLKSKGIDVDVVAIQDPAKGKVANVKKYAKWFMKSLFHLMKNKRNIALTHAHYAFPTGFISMMGKKLFNLPYIVTVHGGDIDKMASKNARIAAMTKKILLAADAVIVVGERLKKDVIERFNVPEENVQVMSMGVDTSVFVPLEKSEARKELGIPSEQKMVLYVGNMIEAKGILELLEASAILQKEDPNITLYLIGSDKDKGFMEKFQEKTASTAVPVVHQLPMQQREVAKWIAAADLFVLPSHHEGFGLVALEAMAIGTPVVGTDVGGLSYLLADNTGILVEPRNAVALAKGMRQALTEVDEDRKLKMEAAVSMHSYDVIAKRLLALYEGIGKK
ncbi:glycosyltransferase [Sporosarcina sp. OR05]|uniref:glycosyltransferase n=1 Tax=Sporosarcina sp. OR05 TaxID=2969819 RepID=UPI00352A2B93